MKINDENVDVDELINKLNINDSFVKKTSNGLLLSNDQINVLTKYGFDYKKYSNLKELLFDIENYLNEETDCEDLEEVSCKIAEFNYYHDTNK